MRRITPTAEQIERVLAAIPEGFIREAEYGRKYQLFNKGRRMLNQALRNGKVGQGRGLLYDATRLTFEEAQALAAWCDPSLPPTDEYGTPVTAPVAERRAARAAQLENDPLALALLARLEAQGYVEREGFASSAEETAALERLLEAGHLSTRKQYIYDPLRLSQTTIEAMLRKEKLRPMHQQLLDYLEAQPGQAASLASLNGQFGIAINDLLAMGGVVKFRVMTPKHEKHMWLRLVESDPEAAEKAALKAIHRQEIEARKAKDREWGALLEQVGDVLRPGAHESKSNRMRVIARSYSLGAAAKRLGVRDVTLRRAINNGKLHPFTDPDREQRLSAAEVEAALADPEWLEQIAAYETLKVREIALVSGVGYSTARTRLQRQQLSTTHPRWGDVRGRWGLPETLADFRAMLRVKKAEWREERQRRHELMMEQLRLQEEAERQRRAELRERLIAVFPAWQHESRVAQHLTLHVGPTNSGKTHIALTQLANAGSGWYLAPLRMLAFEVFERLNARGVPCSLLTGEEYIPVPGAQITASTIEMFNPAQSGACVVIDEAHMLADSDRGWAWTRAFMESNAPEMHVLGPPIIQSLIERLARAIYLPLRVVEHERLSPIRVADHPWSLDHLPPKTILVAFSRRLALALKTQLEHVGRRVSIVYGSLPPEVRRRQAERFAQGETEICVATDAVGMGLNLPADNVCFFEVEKFDGQDVRQLTAAEVQQIGGRAGRFGLSRDGLVGALSAQNLQVVRQLYYKPPEELTRARVAPSVESLALIPGTLAERLEEWMQLNSIPEQLRSLLQTVDLKERIELAHLLRDEEVDQLGLAVAVRLINAPTRQDTRPYWRQCATSILNDWAMPLPPVPPAVIKSDRDLERTETSIQCADVYLWLAQRHEFSYYAPDEEFVRETRLEWSMRVDEALVRQVDTARRCAKCGRKLSLAHRYRLCDSCYYLRRWDGDYGD